MTDSANTRQIALEALLAINRDGEYSHLVIRNILDKYGYLSAQERHFLKRLVQGTIERQMELDAIINRVSSVKVNKMKPPIREILRMGVYQLKYMDSVPDSAACNEAVKLAEKKGFRNLKGFVNGVLRNIARQQIELPDTLSIRYSMPEWIIAMWEESYGEKQTEEILKNLMLEGPTGIRVNLNRTTPEELAEKLRNRGIQVEQNNEVAYGLFLSGYDRLDDIPEFKAGDFYVQDTGSMMVAEAAEPKENDFVLDVCAAPGGKSVHIAEKLNGTGKVEARDITSYKVQLMEENIRRLGLGNMETKLWDATVPDETCREKADVVIADLPCSGLGIIRKKPDIKYKMTPEAVEGLIKLQRSILKTVGAYVKPGGIFVYSTCTINPAENGENAAYFLREFPDFRLCSETQRFPQDGKRDGFYIAKFIKKGLDNAKG